MPEKTSNVDNNIPLQAVMNTVLDGLIIIDTKGIIQSFNKAARKIFGYRSEEVIGQNVKILMPDPYHTEHDDYLKNYIKTKDAQVIGIGREVTAKRKDNSIFPMELGINEMSVGKKLMFVGTIRDISGRKIAENTIRQAEAKIKAIVDNTVDGLITIDDQGSIETFNLACEKIFGYRSEEVIGQNVKILMPEPYHTEHDNYLENYHTTGEKKIIGIGREVEGLKKDGTIFSLDLSVSQVELGDRKIYSGIVRDITERKKSQEEIAKALEQLEESNTELERFAYIASHDLQEPLRMIVSFTTLLQKEYYKKLDDEALEYIHLMVDAASRMQALVCDLLEYSRIGQEAERFVDVSCVQTLEAALANLAESIKQNQAEIIYEDLPIIRGNPVRMARLFQNLIGNAIKYTQPCVKPVIKIKAVESKNKWLFSISDNGIGIKREYLKMIFEPFKRLHTHSEYVGTGIGLAVCKKIVENFGGSLWVKSEEGKGSIFYFSFPKNLLESNKNE